VRILKVYFKEVIVRTQKRRELVDITHEVEHAVDASGISNGLCLVFVPHATAAVVANEHEKGLMNDILRKLEEEYPINGEWEHNLIDDNAAAHLASAFIGSARVFPVKDRRLVRGTWQNIFLVELDGPRSTRRILVEVMGE